MGKSRRQKEPEEAIDWDKVSRLARRSFRGEVQAVEDSKFMVHAWSTDAAKYREVCEAARNEERALINPLHGQKA